MEKEINEKKKKNEKKGKIKKEIKDIQRGETIVDEISEKKEEVVQENFDKEQKEKIEIKNEIETKEQNKKQSMKTFLSNRKILLIGGIGLVLIFLIIIFIMNRKPLIDGHDLMLKLKENIKEIGGYNEYTAQNDPNKLLGEEHQYIYKVVFYDSRIEVEDDNYAGTVEIFKNSKDASLRKYYLEELEKHCYSLITKEEFGDFDPDVICGNFKQYTYLYKNTLVRLNHKLDKSDYDGYVIALDTILKEYRYKEKDVPNASGYEKMKQEKEQEIEKTITKETIVDTFNIALDTAIEQLEELKTTLSSYELSEFDSMTEEDVLDIKKPFEQYQNVPVIAEKVNQMNEKINEIMNLCYGKMATNITEKINKSRSSLSSSEIKKIEEKINTLSDENFGVYKATWSSDIASIKNEIAIEEDRKKTYSQGSYKVGSNIDPGTYIISGSGYYEVCTHADCDIMSRHLLYNDNFKNRAVVILQAGQYFNYRGSGLIYKEAGYDTTLSNHFTSAGYYRIGKDLEAGEYRLEGRGYYAICTKPSCDILSREMIKNDNLTNGGYINVRDGQYLVISGSLTGSK